MKKINIILLLIVILVVLLSSLVTADVNPNDYCQKNLESCVHTCQQEWIEEYNSTCPKGCPNYNICINICADKKEACEKGDEQKDIIEIDDSEKTIETSVTIAGISGEVEILRNGEWISAKNGMELKQSESIATSFSSGVLMRFSDGSTAQLEEVTQIRIDTLFTDEGTRRTDLRLNKGGINANINRVPRVESDFKVTTPTSILGVRGTIFSVTYDEDKKVTEVFTEEGSVSVTDENGNGEVIVNTNGFTSVADSSLPEQPTLNNQVPSLDTSDETNTKEDKIIENKKGFFMKLINFIISLFSNSETDSNNNNNNINEENEITTETTTAAYQEYIEAYNKLTELMSEGKGDTPEAQQAYKEYKVAKERYEQIAKGLK